MSVKALKTKNVKQGDRQMKRAKKEVERIAAFLGLQQTWAIHVRIDDLRADEHNPQRAANVQWPKNYREATIVFDRTFLKEHDDASLERTVLHELLHLVCAQLDDAMQENIGVSSYMWWTYNDHREAVLDTITNLMLLARDGGAGGIGVKP